MQSSILGRLSGSQLQHGLERERTIREPVWPPLIGKRFAGRALSVFPCCAASWGAGTRLLPGPDSLLMVSEGCYYLFQCFNLSSKLKAFKL